MRVTIVVALAVWAGGCSAGTDHATESAARALVAAPTTVTFGTWRTSLDGEAWAPVSTSVAPAEVSVDYSLGPNDAAPTATLWHYDASARSLDAIGQGEGQAGPGHRSLSVVPWRAPAADAGDAFYVSVEGDGGWLYTAVAWH